MLQHWEGVWKCAPTGTCCSDYVDLLGWPHRNMWKDFHKARYSSPHSTHRLAVVAGGASDKTDPSVVDRSSYKQPRLCGGAIDKAAIICHRGVKVQVKWKHHNPASTLLPAENILYMMWSHWKWSSFESFLSRRPRYLTAGSHVRVEQIKGRMWTQQLCELYTLGLCSREGKCVLQSHVWQMICGYL
jgi:hypothetical protein